MTSCPKGTKTNRIKPKTRKDKDHLAYVAQQPCCVSGRRPVVVHHLMERLEDKIGRRDDKYTIPLHPDHHNHAQGVHGKFKHDPTMSVEKGFLIWHGVNGGELALRLWRESHE